MNPPILTVLDPSATIDFWRTVGISFLALCLLAVLAVAVLAGRKGNPSKTWAISFATLIPIVLLGGPFAIGVMAYGQQAATAFHLG